MHVWIHEFLLLNDNDGALMMVTVALLGLTKNLREGVWIMKNNVYRVSSKVCSTFLLKTMMVPHTSRNVK